MSLTEWEELTTKFAAQSIFSPTFPASSLVKLVSFPGLFSWCLILALWTRSRGLHVYTDTSMNGVWVPVAGVRAWNCEEVFTAACAFESGEFYWTQLQIWYRPMSLTRYNTVICKLQHTIKNGCSMWWTWPGWNGMWKRERERELHAAEWSKQVLLALVAGTAGIPAMRAGLVIDGHDRPIADFRGT